MTNLIEDGLYTHLTAQSTITDIVEDRIYPTVMPQQTALPAIVFYNVGTTPISRQDGRPTLVRSRIQIDCYADRVRDAKLLSEAVRDALESYVGMMGASSVQAVFLLEHGSDDFDDIPSSFRISSDYEVWHTL